MESIDAPFMRLNPIQSTKCTSASGWVTSVPRSRPRIIYSSNTCNRLFPASTATMRSRLSTATPHGYASCPGSRPACPQIAKTFAGLLVDLLHAIVAELADDQMAVAIAMSSP